MTRDRLMNVRRADGYLERFGVDALVSSSRENTTYLTNFLSVLYVYDRLSGIVPGGGENFLQTYGVYPRGGEPVLVVPSPLFAAARLTKGVATSIYTYGRDASFSAKEAGLGSSAEGARRPDKEFSTAPEALAAAVRDFAAGPKLGVDLADLHPSSSRALKSSGFSSKDATVLFRFIRMSKSDEELRRLRRAAQVNEAGLQFMLDRIRPGASEAGLAREYSKAIVAEGAAHQPGQVFCPAGPDGSEMLPPRSRKLVSGDLVWIDVICSLDGYYSDTGESSSVGPPDPRQVRVYQAMKEFVQRAEDSVLPGQKPSQLLREVEPIWNRHGLPRPPIMLGHGIGLEPHEHPTIADPRGLGRAPIRDDFIRSTADIPFEEGMVLNFESAFFVRGWGGVHLERTVVLGKSGCKPIAEQPRSLRVAGSEARKGYLSRPD